MKNRSGFQVMTRLVGLVKPLGGYMSLAVLMGLIGHLCAAFLTVFGGYGLIMAAKRGEFDSFATLFLILGIMALLRGVLRYGEQACNHFIAFKLLALLRDRVFRALRRLCPAKLEGKEKGNLIAVITSDIELLEVFYAHTISPVLIAVLFTILLCLFIGSFHWALGLLALVAYGVVGVLIPLIISKKSGEDGLLFRTRSGKLSSFVLDSLRGLTEILQYGQGKPRLDQMNEQTDKLAKEEEKMKRMAGKNAAITGFAVLFFDLSMLFVALFLFQQRLIEAEGVWLSSLALFSRPLRPGTGYWICWMNRQWYRILPDSPSFLFPGPGPIMSRFHMEKTRCWMMFRFGYRKNPLSELWAKVAAENQRYSNSLCGFGIHKMGTFGYRV